MQTDEYFYKKGNADQEANVEKFKHFRHMMEGLYPALVTFRRPAPLQSPWHWQAEVAGGDGYKALFNFWPHKDKWAFQNARSQDNILNAAQAINSCIAFGEEHV